MQATFSRRELARIAACMGAWMMVQATYSEMTWKDIDTPGIGSLMVIRFTLCQARPSIMLNRVQECSKGIRYAWPEIASHNTAHDCKRCRALSCTRLIRRNSSSSAVLLATTPCYCFYPVKLSTSSLLKKWHTTVPVCHCSTHTTQKVAFLNTHSHFLCFCLC